MSRSNKNLTKARAAKNDEFYTQISDVEAEMNAYFSNNPDVFRDKTVLLPCDDPEWSAFTKFFSQNFERLGLRRLISTSLSKSSEECGKLFVLDRDITGDGKINLEDLEWTYLRGSGDFRSEEVTALRDESDIIVTNPPFSLFREFLAWIMQGGKGFSIIGSVNAITYKEVFPLIKDNKIWLGATGFNKSVVFGVPDSFEYSPNYKGVKEIDNKKACVVPSICWYTNIEHGRRHQPLALMTMEDNLRYNKKMKGKEAYDRYDNYDAIEVPFTDAIPSDYDGVMGVPITFLGSYCPEQFEILGNEYDLNLEGGRGYILGKRMYSRVFIRKLFL